MLAGAGKVIVFASGVTGNERVTEAAATTPVLPAWLAVIAHVPTDTNTIAGGAAAVTVQTPVAFDA